MWRDYGTVSFSPREEMSFHFLRRLLTLRGALQHHEVVNRERRRLAVELRVHIRRAPVTVQELLSHVTEQEPRVVETQKLKIEGRRPRQELGRQKPQSERRPCYEPSVLGVEEFFAASPMPLCCWIPLMR